MHPRSRKNWTEPILGLFQQNRPTAADRRHLLSRRLLSESRLHFLELSLSAFDPLRTSVSDLIINNDPPDLMRGTNCKCGGSVHVFPKFGQRRWGVAPFVAYA